MPPSGGSATKIGVKQVKSSQQLSIIAVPQRILALVGVLSTWGSKSRPGSGYDRFRWCEKGFSHQDATKLTDFADLSFIFANLTDTASDQDHSDINKDGRVNFADISDADGFIGSIDPGKPTGHTCLP